MRRVVLSIIGCLLIFGCSTTLHQKPADAFSAGYERVLIGTADRPLQLDIWYPSDAAEAAHRYGLTAGSAAVGADPLDGPYPLVVLSPGAFGSASNYSWLAEGLARDGFVTVGLSHFREAYDYGPETIDYTFAGRFDLRVQDIRSALSHLSAEKGRFPFIDLSNVTLVGHSSGGATATLAVGGLFEGAQLQAWCASAESKGDVGCNYVAGVPDGFTLPSFGPWTLEDIDRIVLLDPAVGPGINKGSLRSVDVPALVIGASNNDFLPYDAHAGKYVRLLRNVESLVLEDGSGHFVFLDDCDAEIDVFGVPLCKDRPGVDRTEVHAEVYSAVRAFMER